MPIISAKTRKWSPPRPKKADKEESAPFISKPEWDGFELPELKDKDIIPDVWGGQIEHNWGKVIDPLDCEAWSNSPYCDFFGSVDLKGRTGGRISVSANLCGVSVRVQPQLGWLFLAPATATWRSNSEECRIPPPEQDFPQRTSATFYRYPFGHWGCIYRVKATISYPTELSEVWSTDITFFDCFGPFEGYSLVEQPLRTRNEEIYNLSPVFYAHGVADYFPNYFTDPAFPSFRPVTPMVAVHFRETAQSYTSEHSVTLEIWEINNEMPDREVTNSLFSKIAYNQYECKPAQPIPLIPYIPDDMCNCEDIEESLESIKQILGADKGGWKVPAKLTGLGTEMVEFNNYAELFLWTIRSFSETLGDTEIKIKLKDADLTQDGDQEQELSYANLGEAIADILGLLLDNKGLSGAIYKASAHGLAQSAVATIAASKTLKIVEDIADFLDYKVEEDEEEIELFLTPTKERPDEYLDKSTQKFSYLKYKGKNSLSTHLHELLFAAALIRSQFWHRVDDEGFARFEDAVEAGQGDLDTFLEKVEQGFPAEPGNIDTSKPYGRPYEERPRIRKISQPQNDGSNS